MKKKIAHIHIVLQQHSEGGWKDEEFSLCSVSFSSIQSSASFTCWKIFILFILAEFLQLKILLKSFISWSNRLKEENDTHWIWEIMFSAWLCVWLLSCDKNTHSIFSLSFRFLYLLWFVWSRSWVEWKKLDFSLLKNFSLNESICSSTYCNDFSPHYKFLSLLHILSGNGDGGVVVAHNTKHTTTTKNWKDEILC